MASNQHRGMHYIDEYLQIHTYEQIYTYGVLWTNIDRYCQYKNCVIVRIEKFLLTTNSREFMRKVIKHDHQLSVLGHFAISCLVASIPIAGGRCVNVMLIVLHRV